MTPSEFESPMLSVDVSPYTIILPPSPPPSSPSNSEASLTSLQPYSPSNEDQFTSLPGLGLGLRKRQNIDYNEKRKKRAKMEKPIEVKKKRKEIVVNVDDGEWKPMGKSEKRRVYYHNDINAQLLPCFSSVKRQKDGETLTVGDDVMVKTEDENGEVMMGVARISALYIPTKSKYLQAAILWYYTPSQCESMGGCVDYHPMEVFPSRHMDSTPLTAIEGKATVMRYKEWCRLHALRARSSTHPFSIFEGDKEFEGVDEKKAFFTRFHYDLRKRTVVVKRRNPNSVKIVV